MSGSEQSFHARRRFRGRIFAILVALMLVSPPGGAQEHLPVEITSDTAEHNESANRVTYAGNVVVTQGVMTMRCSHLTLSTAEDADRIIVATGEPVHFHREATEDASEIHARSARAEYDLDNRTLTLIGDAEVEQQGDRVSSDRIVYDLATSTVKAGVAAEGKQRVRTVIQPKN
ncbi:MAG: lipopolysaccharide transport periplasmic protein LptA [Pseudomonadota bacterium]